MTALCQKPTLAAFNPKSCIRLLAALPYILAIAQITRRGAMSEYEYMDLFFTLVERSEAAGLTFLTVTSGYLIVAYLVGDKLTRGQVILVSALFFCYAIAQILAQVSQINSILHIDQIMYENFPESPLQSSSTEAKLGFIWPALEFLAVCASLHFMRSIRHTKTD
jgi:hypothetical protein